jgi:hypothetical protein
MALGYLLYAFLAALGTLQIVAARYQLTGLSLAKASENPRRGYVLGSLLVAGSSVVFFFTQWQRVLTPGPAGSELALLFGLGAALAVAAALFTASLGKGTLSGVLPTGDEDTGKEVMVGLAAGRLYAPQDPGAPLPAVCLIGGRHTRYQRALVTLAHELVQSQIVALLIRPEREQFTYPELLAFLPAATALLGKLPEVDPQRVGALGFGLGGDLVLRAASSHRALRATVALAPLLAESEVGVSLLHELKFRQAWRWARDEERASLQVALAAPEYAQKISPRPILLVHGAHDRLASWPDGLSAGVESGQTSLLTQESVTVREVPSAAHFDLLDQQETIETVVGWLKENL